MDICARDACCKGIGMCNKTCFTSNIASHTLAYIKEADCAGTLGCPAPQQCYQQIAPHCTRTMTVGTDGREGFSFEMLYASVLTDIHRIGILLDATDGQLYGLELDYDIVADKITCSEFWGHTSPPVYQECLLEDNEYNGTSNKCILYEPIIYGYLPVQMGIAFVTSRQVCGLYGITTGDAVILDVGKLLFIGSRYGQYFYALNFTFYTC